MTIRSVLREKTSSLHDEIEQSTIMGDLVKDSMTVDKLGEILLQYQCWLFPVERKLSLLLEDAPSRFCWEVSHSSSRLAADFKNHSNELVHVESSDLPQYSNLHQVWGGLYVLEGSHFGMEMVKSYLTQKLGEQEISRWDFFKAGKEPARDRWQQFCVNLERLPLLHGGEESVVAGARNTYESLINHLISVDSSRPQTA